MSVDFYYCEACGESKHEESVGECGKCHNSLCTGCLINKPVNSICSRDYGVVYDPTKPDSYYEDLGDCEYTLQTYGCEPGEIIDDSGIDPKYCPFCSCDKIDRDQVLVYLLGNRKIEDVWAEMKSADGQ